MQNKSFLIFILIILAIGIYFLLNGQRIIFPGREDKVACTQDAKICPDGSFVGRVGPNCEFAKCPGKTATPSGSVSK